jgi:transposase InsO family protein
VAVLSIADLSDSDMRLTVSQNRLLIDSGSEIHVCSNIDMFLSIGDTDLDRVQPIGPAELKVQGKGVIQVCLGEYVNHGGSTSRLVVEIPNVYYVPDCHVNILSTAVLRKQNIFLTTKAAGDYVIIPGFSDQSGLSSPGDLIEQSVDDKGDPILIVGCMPDIPRPTLATYPVNSKEAWRGPSTLSGTELYDRDLHVAAVVRNVYGPTNPDYTGAFMAHVVMLAGQAALKLMADSPLFRHFKIEPRRIADEVDRCHGCKLADLEKGPVKHHGGKLRHRVASYPGAYLYADLMGPISPRGIGGARYVLVVVDEHSGFTWGVPLTNKGQAAGRLVEIIEHVRTHVLRRGTHNERDPDVDEWTQHMVAMREGHDAPMLDEDAVPEQAVLWSERVLVLWTDRGGEFMSNELAEFLHERRIHHITSAPGQHESNGVAERRIGLISKKLRQALLPSGLPKYLWPECVQSVVRAFNLTPSKTTVQHRQKRFVEQRLEAWIEEHAPEVISDTDDDSDNQPILGASSSSLQSAGVKKTKSVDAGVKKTKPAGADVKKTKSADKQDIKKTTSESGGQKNPAPDPAKRKQKLAPGQKKKKAGAGEKNPTPSEWEAKLGDLKKQGEQGLLAKFQNREEMRGLRNMIPWK